MSKLEVEISGDVKKLKSAINDATGQLKGLAKQGVDAGKKVNRNALSAARGIKGLSNQTVNAVPAMQEFSRIIQDAPYGIQGVANNIQQLTAQFGYLSTKAGGSKNALKAMLGSLAGPSGILLAVSAVTTLLVSFGDKLFSSSKKADKLKSSSKGVNDELKNQSAILKALIKDYGNFEKIKEQTTFNTTKEKETVRALFSILRDDLSTTKERERAYIALNKKYSEYLKNVDPKSIYQLTLAERRLNKQLEVREKRIQTLNKLEEVSRGLQLVTLKIEKLRSQNVSMFSKRAKALQAENAELYKLQKQLREALELYTSLDTTIGKVREQKPIVVPITIGQPAGLTRVDTGVSVAALQAQIKALKDQQAQVSKTSEQWQEYALKIKEVQKQLELITKGDAKSLLGNTIAGQIAADIEAINIQRLKEKMQEIQFSANMLSQSIQQSFANVTNSISQNLQNSLGFLGSFLGELLNFFTQVIQARIRQQVQEMALAKKQQIINAVTAKSQLASDKVRAASSAAVAASNTAKAAGPKGAFLLPILIAGALGAVSSAFSKIGGSGGSFGGSSVAGAGLSRGFSSGTTFGGARPFSGNLTFTIRGTDLVAVYNLANAQNAIIGGNVSVG